MEDTLSSVLSYIDGSSTFATQKAGEDFKLTSGEQVISGMLHDFFLATLEDEEKDCRGICSSAKIVSERRYSIISGLPRHTCRGV